ncbi:unnamed protein product [Ectocarpus sp. 12 AP-2014]
MKGELPVIIRRTLERHTNETNEAKRNGRHVSRNTLRSRTGVRENPTRYNHPPEATARDRITINITDFARTQPEELLNDRLVDLGLRVRLEREVEQQKAYNSNLKVESRDTTSSTPDVVEDPPTMSSDVSVMGVYEGSAKATQRA